MKASDVQYRLIPSNCTDLDPEGPTEFPHHSDAVQAAKRYLRANYTNPDDSVISLADGDLTYIYVRAWDGELTDNFIVIERDEYADPRHQHQNGDW